jgi:hypothetical protein
MLHPKRQVFIYLPFSIKIISFQNKNLSTSSSSMGFP